MNGWETIERENERVTVIDGVWFKESKEVEEEDGWDEKGKDEVRLKSQNYTWRERKDNGWKLIQEKNRDSKERQKGDRQKTQTDRYIGLNF